MSATSTCSRRFNLLAVYQDGMWFFKDLSAKRFSFSSMAVTFSRSLRNTVFAHICTPTTHRFMDLVAWLRAYRPGAADMHLGVNRSWGWLDALKPALAELHEDWDSLVYLKSSSSSVTTDCSMSRLSSRCAICCSLDASGRWHITEVTRDANSINCFFILRQLWSIHHWWSHLFSVAWTTVMIRSSVSLNICNGSNLWCTPPHNSSTHHQSSATSLCSSNEFTGSRQRSRLTSRSLF